MLNVDKYRDELLEEMGNRREKVEGNCDDNCSGVEIYFRSIEVVKRRHGGGYSALFSDDVKWLFSEYEPPLLENGDGLKPGDWIMVRDEDDQIWKKERFLSFANGSFYCIKSLFGSHDGKTNRDLYGEFVCYRQARLPGDGE